MPRLYHRPPKYCLHKGTKQATVSLNGELGPYGSRESHIAYQKVLQDWHKQRNGEATAKQPEKAVKKIANITAASLREKRQAGEEDRQAAEEGKETYPEIAAIFAALSALRRTELSAHIIRRAERDTSNWKWVGRWERMHR